MIPRDIKFCIQPYITIKSVICKCERNVLIISGDREGPHNVCCRRCPHNDNETRIGDCVCVLAN